MVKIIECFGPSGAGKTYKKKIIEQYLVKKKLKVYDYKKAILFFSNQELNLSIKEKLVLSYYKFIKSNLLKKASFVFNRNIKTKIISPNIHLNHGNVYKIYNDICSKVYKKFKKKNTPFVKFVNKSIKDSNFDLKAKNIFKNWFIQECAGKYLFNKHNKKHDILLDSEGFIQRINIYAYKKKNKLKIIQDYLKLCPLPEVLIVSKKRKSIKKKDINKQLSISLEEQSIIYQKTLNNLRKKNNLIIVKKFFLKTTQNLFSK